MAESDDISYLAFIGQSPHSAGTRDIRRRYVGEYVAWLDEEGIDPLTAVASDIIRYLDSVQRAPSTRELIRNSIRAYYRWLEDKGAIERSPAAQIRSEPIARHPAKFIPVDDVRKLLAAARSDQNWLIIALLTFNSLRISEVLALNVSDVSMHGRQRVLTLRTAPSHRPRSAVLVEEVVEVLDRHLAGRRHGPLFLNRAGDRLTRMTASSSVVDWTGRHARLSYKVTPEMLTNTLTAVALERGFSYRGLARAIGTPERRHSERWLATSEKPTDDNATVRLARLVFHDPDSATALMVHVEALLNETDLPEPLAIAAVGAVFERHLRALCTAYELDVRPNPKDGSIHGYVALLHGAKRIALRERHTCEQIGEARNNAAHGAFEHLTPAAARHTLHAIEAFLADHPLPDTTS